MVNEPQKHRSRTIRIPWKIMKTNQKLWGKNKTSRDIANDGETQIIASVAMVRVSKNYWYHIASKKDHRHRITKKV